MEQLLLALADHEAQLKSFHRTMSGEILLGFSETRVLGYIEKSGFCHHFNHSPNFLEIARHIFLFFPMNYFGDAGFVGHFQCPPAGNAAARSGAGGESFIHQFFVVSNCHQIQAF